MAIQTITYDNKVALNTNPEIADINKITDNDMNEIKSVVNNNANETSTNSTNIQNVINAEAYSTNEVKTNSIWIDNKPIYRKTINTGALPNNIGKTVNHNISNIEYICKIQGIAFRNSSGTFLPLPSATYDNTAVSCYADKQKITIVTYTDRSSFTDSYVTLEYTKTTD